MRAISADSELLHRGAQSLAGRIHSVFDKAVNVRSIDGSLWAMAAKTAPDAPATIRLDVTSLHRYGLSAGKPVAVSDETVVIAACLTVDLGAAAPWDPSRSHGPLDTHRVSVADGALRRYGIRVEGRADLIGAATSARIASAVAEIGRAVRRQDAAKVRAATASIVGLGVGLTPSGDDVLTGLVFAATQLGGPLDIVPEAVGAVATDGATHDLSLTMLRAACRGRAAQPLAAVLAALRGVGDVTEIVPLMADLIAIGHTSGTDQAEGLLAAVHMFMGMRGAECQPDH